MDSRSLVAGSRAERCDIRLRRPLARDETLPPASRIKNPHRGLAPLATVRA